MKATVTIDRVENGFIVAGVALYGETMDIARTWPEACECARGRLRLDEKFCDTDEKKDALRKLLGKEEEHG